MIRTLAVINLKHIRLYQESINVKKGDVEAIQMIQVLVEKEKERRNDQNKISTSIYIVNNILRNLIPSSFNPHVVAIGPLHKEDDELQDLETHKVTYLVDLFHRLPSTVDQKMDECVQRVYAKVQQIRACYTGEMKEYDDLEVTKMMVIDGCFILEFILGAAKNNPEDDPVFYNKLVSANVMRDLILLENQIPFFVLQEIFKFTILEIDPSSSLQTVVLLFLEPIIPFVTYDISYVTNIINDGVDTSYDHILGLLQKVCQPADATKPFGFFVTRFHSTVVELIRAGVNFVGYPDKRWPLSMEFKASRFPRNLKPTFRMPVLCIDDHTESVFRNLIAYEQCSPSSATYITSYAAAMDMLVDTQEDIIKMVDSEVLINDLGTNQDAADMINSICKNTVLENFHYDQQWDQLYNYYNGLWPKNIARLRRITYFSSRWNFIAVVAGIILFGLTVVQTHYAIIK